MVEITAWAWLRCYSDKKSRVVLRAPLPVHVDYPTKLLTWGDHIKKRRVDLKLCKTEAAEIIGSNEWTIRNWEEDRHEIRISFYPKIISFLGYHPFSENPETVQDLIRIHKEKTGLSFKKLARKIGVDEASVKRFAENGGSKFQRMRKAMLTEIPELNMHMKD